MSFLFFQSTATTDIYTLSLHDALPIYHFFVGQGLEPSDQCSAIKRNKDEGEDHHDPVLERVRCRWWGRGVSNSGCQDRKSTRLNSSHLGISYAVFCLKKKTNKEYAPDP